ncbi:type II toxin-antitoxin system HicB family antitoxin [Methanoculleus frigidifontis]|uniref:type II toxin-antitoxin system HicB family antitoxin n=1 Tax=Methanoculleus frigidifontis TaxID=2584085 RepID=UPI002659EBCE|nr:type II toxin-antitoxin system HicB family antitoxin [Methanoculleus sp. FWC-SCC1]
MRCDEPPAVPYPPPEGAGRRVHRHRAGASQARVTFGETVDEAIAMAREAIGVYIEDLREKGEEIPTEEGL